MLRTYVLVQFLEDLQDGDEFSRRAWPLHLTIVPNFSIALDESAIQERIRAAAAGYGRVAVAARHEALFGPQGDVRVTVLDPLPDLMALHNSLVEHLANAGGTFEHPEYVRRGYRPHVAVASHRRLQPGERILVDSLSIVDLQPGGNANLRRVLDTVSLPAGSHPSFS